MADATRVKRRMKSAKRAMKNSHIQDISDGLKSRRRIRKVRVGISFSDLFRVRPL